MPCFALFCLFVLPPFTQKFREDCRKKAQVKTMYYISFPHQHGLNFLECLRLDLPYHMIFSFQRLKQSELCAMYIFPIRFAPDFSECFVLFVSSATSQPSDHAPAGLGAHRQAPGRPSRLLTSYLSVGWFWSETQTPSQPRCVTDVFPPFPTLNGLINAYR